MKFKAILLAGGLSTRMGKDKAMLSLHGVTLLQSAYDKIAEVFKQSKDQILVSGNYSDFDSITDIRPGNGPIEGIWSCTRTIEYDSAVLVFPVDMPLLTTSQFKVLFRQIMQEHNTGSSIELVQFENYEMPFVFIYNAKTEKILSAVRDKKSNSERSIRHFKSELHKTTIAESDFSYFINVNTPTEWEEVNDETSFECE